MCDETGKSKPRRETWLFSNQAVFNFVCYVCIYTLLPMFVILLITCAILRQLIHIYLKIKHGHSYGGMLLNEEVIYPPENPQKSVINILMIADIKSKSFEEYISHVKLRLRSNVFDCPDKYPKLTYTFSRFLGYSYLLKKNVHLDDCLSIVDVTTDSIIDDSLLKDTLNQYCNRSLPRNGSILWEIVIFSKPVKWIVDDSENATNGYLMIVRCNHVVGDGTSLMTVFSDILGLKENAPSVHLDKIPLQKPPQNLIQKLQKILWPIYLGMLAFYVVFYNSILRKEERNMLQMEELATENIFVYKVERTRILLDMVKRIKSKIPNMTFTDIYLTAISASLETLFKNNSQYSPRSITVGLTALLKPPVWNKAAFLENNFVFANMTLPVCTDSTMMLQKLMLVKKHRDVLKNSSDYQVNSFVLKIVLRLLPTLFLKPLAHFDNLTMIITNIPGPSKLSARDGTIIMDTLGYVPIPGKIGATFDLLTYDGRFQIGLSVNKALISQEDAQTLVDDIFNKLHLLNDEVQKRYC